MYAIWVKVDETLPWIELSGTYQTEKEARKVTKELLSKIKIKIVKVEKERKSMKAVATVKR
ncbi:hypothetical protein C0199_00655 [Candidatus Bathyarchaeota archaeon]|nr:MAG: hypothetical protein C0199_00655 [Candidatus Bathyarchaeota archaeon]